MKLIYIMDPLCGWCYGNSVNMLKLYNKFKDILDFEILPAGMWAGENVRKQTQHIAAYIKKHDPQIQQLTGTEFGADYFKFIENEEVILDSETPSRAIISVTRLWPEIVIPFTVEVQRARYWYGKDLNNEETYLTICDALNLDKNKFLNTFHSKIIKEETISTFSRASSYANSYPTLLAEKNNEIYVLEQGYAAFESITEQIDSLLLLN